MNKQSVRQIDDIARITPGLNLETGGLRQTNISIRGISSPAGNSTTGLYIDETPIQARLLGNASGNTYPRVYDLERVEVLRGPQGTLFGAGAQGGVVRFITPQPSVTTFSGSARAEVSQIDGGGANYEGGVAVGGPIVEDKLGFRFSAFYRHEGGYIDRVVGKFAINSPTGALGPKQSLTFTSTGTLKENSNYSDINVIRAAVTWMPTPDLEVTPSVFYQKEKNHDLIQGYWPALSNPGGGDFAVPTFVASVDATHDRLPADAPLYEPNKDRFVLPAVLVTWDLGDIKMVSNTAYFDRDQKRTPDYTITHIRTYIPGQYLPDPGDKAYAIFTTTQQNFSQEIRFQSDNPDSRLNWVAGGFYTRNKQSGNQLNPNNFYNYEPIIGNSSGRGVTNGAPFGPGFTAAQNFFGVDKEDGIYQYVRLLDSTDTQAAAFVQVDYNLTEKLKVTAGVRGASSKFEYYNRYGGPSNNLTPPQGLNCVPGTRGATCIPLVNPVYGQGAVAPSFVNGGGQVKEKPVTPKFGISYQADDYNMYYASAAKGFRTGGAQGRLPSSCDAQLIQFGYVDANGNAKSPETYTSDSVWSYEAGSKNRLFDNRLELSASAFYIKWKDIQSTVSISSCTQSFVDNVGSATSKGFDFASRFKPLDDLTIGLNVGYTDATLAEDFIVGGRVLFSDGSGVAASGAPWTVTLNGEYTFMMGAFDGYVRGDWTFRSKEKVSGATDIKTVSYDSQLAARDEYHQVNARAGLNISDVEVSVFIDNLLNAHPSLGLSRSINTPNFTDYTLRPRTMGVSVSQRF